ncbi:NAD(P)-dependent dehydrogenase, short-chain alcohol dehydrogenase family [Modicisalibacter muralis]|uniref:NAD(P)-dependent dehydrogenase, short-chain alcohol dehydrogenase family n=1 Tax=Modicisalibacter muralis TaxID=119000 RepID=A0A1G9GUF4_9GAMM|nr:SDR family NAD(P)-dependent oxidoreductase [Halomonas muralis]SDL04234.1 NAD(P)-dependent dehydrogenase, short-chain alcohol dehydrogenase family [Halomonas muralis]
MNDLSSKHALVTGGGSGIGATIARMLAEAGARVTICGRRAEPLEALAATHTNIHSRIADVTDEVAMQRLYDDAERDHGPVDIIVANAGLAHSAPFGRTSLESWTQTLDVNLTGAFLTVKPALSGMSERGWGRVIFVASTAGLKGYAYVAPYVAAKHGVIGLCRALAIETAKTGVTVNAICPGFTETEMLDASLETIVDKTGKSAEQARAALVSTNPMGRFVQPEEVAQAVLWLCGTNSGAVTGQALSVSGGETC